MKGQPKRRVLGKGLGSLIPDVPGDDPLATGDSTTILERGSGTALEIPIDRILPNPHQPRRKFDEEEIASLATSIKSSGVLQALLVRPEKDGTYTLIAGERRLRAAGLAGLATVPAVTRDLPDSRLLEFALIENIQRDDLDPIETAQAFRNLIRKFGLTQAEVAARVGKPRSTVANYLRLLDLPPDLHRLLQRGELDMGHGRALAGLPKPKDQLRVGLKAAAKGWSVREVEQQVRRLLNPEERSSGDATGRKDPNVSAAEQALAQALEARVSIHQGRSGRGRIEILFADDGDLERLYDLLSSARSRRRR